MSLAKHSHSNGHIPPPGLRLPVAAPPEVSSPTVEWHVESHSNGTVLYRHVDEVHHLYLVKKGRVRLLRPTEGGGKALIALLGVGEIFGEYDKSAESIGEFAVAGSDVEVWSVASAHLQAFCEHDPAASVDLISGLSMRMRHMRRRVVGFTAKEVPARLSDTLLNLGDSHGEPCSHGGEIDLRQITQQDLADLVGASRSFVSTLINEMKREGSLGSVGRVLCLRDVKALRKAALREA